MAKFSVIIPIYNAAETLAETLQSIKHQTYTDWEIVAVNDGSTDESAALFQGEMAEFENAKLLSQENCGLGAARNAAAKNAKGEWLVFLDADDVWSSNKLAILDAQLTENAAAECAYHAVFERNESGKLRARKFHPVNTLTEFIEKGNPFVPSAMAIKKALFMKLGGFIEDRNQVEDLLFWFRLFARKTVFVSFPNALTVYRIGFGVTANLQDHLQKVLNALEQAFAENLLSKQQKEDFLHRKNYEAARQLHKSGQFEKALSYYALCKDNSLKKSVLNMFCKMKIVL